jgi:HK97 family phage portal protein
MNRATLAMRLKGALTGWRAPMLGFGTTQGEGWIPKEWDWNFWQEGKDPIFMACCSAVEAAVSAYAQTVAMLPGTVWRKQDDGGRIELPQSQLAKILQQPNAYQTRSDFLMNQVRALYFTGNCYAVAEKNNQDRVVALHPIHPQHVVPYINRETNDIFWSIAPSDLTPQDGPWPLDGSRLIPDEYVWHVALATPYSPLCGVTPLTSACLSMAANCNLNRQMLAFLANASRPSGTLNTDLKMTKDGVEELRARWKEHSTGAGIGGTPILTHGLKWNPLELSSPDAQLIEFYKLTIADIARALRVPLPLIGVMDGATFNNSEVLMQFWKASGLGFLLEHLELSLDKFFNLPAGTYCELDADALLRSEFKNRVDGLVRGVQGGIFSPNEARRMEGLPAVAEGDMPRVQQQLVPLDYTPPEPSAPVAPVAAPAPAAANDPADDAAEIERALAPFLSPMLARLAAMETRMAVLGDRSDRAPDETAHAMALTRGVVEGTERRVKSMLKRANTNAANVSDLAGQVTAGLATLADLSARIDARLATLKDGRDGTLFAIHCGPWLADKVYNAGDVVTVTNGGWWMANATTCEFPVSDSEAWREVMPPPSPGKGFQYRGLFQGGMVYQPGDVVTGAEGAAWITNEGGLSNECPGEIWQLFVKQGERGRGRPGATIANVICDGATVTIHMTDGRAFSFEVGAAP